MMDKNILYDYIDACELIKEAEEDIKKLKRKRGTIAHANVKGSNPEFPYNPQHFTTQGLMFTHKDESKLKAEEHTLIERRENASKLKAEVEVWLNTAPSRMQRIIRYKVFEGMTWEQVANKIGRNATGDGIRAEYKRFMKKK